MSFYSYYNSYLNTKSDCNDNSQGSIGIIGNRDPQGLHGATFPFQTPTAGTDGDVVKYVSSTQTSHYGSAKTFVIDHPIYENKYLIHACLEGPENGVYYRGKSEITNNEHTIIQLPDYVIGLASDFTINVTGIYDGKIKIYNCSEVDHIGRFKVYGENGKFHWTVMGKRSNINIEPKKNEITIKGNGPYKWYE